MRKNKLFTVLWPKMKAFIEIWEIIKRRNKISTASPNYLQTAFSLLLLSLVQHQDNIL